MTKNGKDEPFVITSQSPYFVHPSDSPGAIITAIKFDGKNYDLWEMTIRTSLKSKNKLSFIDGSITKPDLKDRVITEEGKAWEMVKSMIVSWIMNVIDPKLHKGEAYVDSAQKLLENIQKRYAVPNIPNIHKAEIASCKQNKQDIVDFFSKLVGQWNELDGYIKILACTCGAAAKITKLLEENKVHQFLIGLDDEPYSVMRSQILAMDPLPSLDKIYNMVQQEEHHKSVMADRDFKTEHMVAFAVNHLA